MKTKRPPAPRALIGLLTISLVTLALYSLLADRYPLGPSLALPRATWVMLAEGNPAWFAVHIGIYLGLSLLYAVALHLLNTQVKPQDPQDKVPPSRSRWVNTVIIISWVAFSFTLMTMAPAGESHDIFDYVFRGRMMAEEHANPLAEIPKNFYKAPYYRYLAWHSNVDTYGPLWEITSAGVANAVRQAALALGWRVNDLPSCPNNPASCRLLSAYITGYRMLAILLTGISAALIASLVKGSQPRLVSAALAAWLWNPLTLIAAAVGGHNDFLMLACFLLALWFMQRSRSFLALVSLILAAHVKFTALIWMPVFVLWIIRKWGWRRAAREVTGSAILGLTLSWLLYMPFDGWGTLPRMFHERSLYLANSIWQVLYAFLYQHQGWQKGLVFRLTVDLPNWLFAASLILLSLWMLNFRPKRWQRSPDSFTGTDRQLWVSLSAVSLLCLVVGAFWFQHWYILWVLAPASLIPGSVFTRLVLPWMGFGALSANLSENYLMEFYVKPISTSGGESKTPRLLVNLLTVLIIWGPALIASGLAWFSRRRKGLGE